MEQDGILATRHRGRKSGRVSCRSTSHVQWIHRRLSRPCVVTLATEILMQTESNASLPQFPPEASVPAAPSPTSHVVRVKEQMKKSHVRGRIQDWSWRELLTENSVASTRAPDRRKVRPDTGRTGTCISGNFFGFLQSAVFERLFLLSILRAVCLNLFHSLVGSIENSFVRLSPEETG